MYEDDDVENYLNYDRDDYDFDEDWDDDDSAFYKEHEPDWEDEF